MQNQNISIAWMFCDLMQCHSNLTFWWPLYVENYTEKKKINCKDKPQSIWLFKDIWPKQWIEFMLFVFLTGNNIISLFLGDITQKGYEKKRAKVLAPYLTQIQSENYRNIPAFSPSSFFLLGRPLTHMIMWLWNIFSGCFSWGFHPKSLCAAFYCSNIGLQHETLFYCQSLLRDRIVVLFWRYLRWKPQFFVLIFPIFCSHWLHLPVLMKLTLLSLQIWLRLRHMMHSPLVQAPPPPPPRHLNLNLNLNLARRTHPPPLHATGAHGDHTGAAGLEMNATDQVRTAWQHIQLFFCYIFFTCYYSESQSLTLFLGGTKQNSKNKYIQPKAYL